MLIYTLRKKHLKWNVFAFHPLLHSWNAWAFHYKFSPAFQNGMLGFFQNGILKFLFDWSHAFHFECFHFNLEWIKVFWKALVQLCILTRFLKIKHIMGHWYRNKWLAAQRSRSSYNRKRRSGATKSRNHAVLFTRELSNHSANPNH